MSKEYVKGTPQPEKQESQENLAVKLLGLECQTHSQAIMGFCTDNTCNVPQKFICSECLFDEHNGHRIARIKLVQELLSNEYSRNQGLSDSHLAEFTKSTEQVLKEESQNLLGIISETFQEFKRDFMHNLNCELQDELHDSQKGGLNIGFLLHKKVSNLSPEENAIICKVISSGGSGGGDVSVAQQNADIKPVVLEGAVKFKAFRESLRAIFKATETQLLEKLRNIRPEQLLEKKLNKATMEWCNKCYSTYEFYYDLTEDNKVATKIKQSGTMTIVRAKEQLEPGFIHFIELLVTWKSEMDYDIGVGSESIGKLCWLRVPGSYGIGSNGIYSNGEKKGEKVLVDGKRVKIEVNLKENVGKVRIFMEGKQLVDSNCDVKDMYLMAAMRAVNDSVRILKYKKD